MHPRKSREVQEGSSPPGVVRLLWGRQEARDVLSSSPHFGGCRSRVEPDGRGSHCSATVERRQRKGSAFSFSRSRLIIPLRKGPMGIPLTIFACNSVGRPSRKPAIPFLRAPLGQAISSGWLPSWSRRKRPASRWFCCPAISMEQPARLRSRFRSRRDSFTSRRVLGTSDMILCWTRGHTGGSP